MIPIPQFCLAFFFFLDCLGAFWCLGSHLASSRSLFFSFFFFLFGLRFAYTDGFVLFFVAVPWVPICLSRGHGIGHKQPSATASLAEYFVQDSQKEFMGNFAARPNNFESKSY
jgi:hypothetical protein